MRSFGFILATSAALAMTPAAWSEPSSVQIGGDHFYSGEIVNETVNLGRDGFLAGRTVTAGGVSQGDLHVSGFDVTVNAETVQDLYAFGATVILRGAVGEDLTAAGFTVRAEESAAIQGNARMFAKTVTIEGPIDGALMAMGQDVILNAQVKGDARIAAQSISFGPEAVVTGTLTYSSDDQLTVPERVAAPERVVFEKLDISDTWEEWEDMGREMPILPSFASMFFGFIVTLLFYLVIGAMALTFIPKRLQHMRQSIAAAPGRSILLGVVGLSMLIGMIPILAMTIVGIPFVPIVILGLIAVWILGYALGAYSVAMRVWSAISDDPEPGKISRLVVLAAAITTVALLNFIPFVGWVVNYTLVLLGVGALTRALFMRLMGNPGAAFDLDMQPIED